MCPFVEENEEDEVYDAISDSDFGRGMVSHFFRNDRKYLFIGGTAVAVVLIAIIGIVSSSISPVNIDELPVIQAEKTPIKEKPLKNNQVKHQDKIIYDNISGNHRQVVEKIADQPETVLSIPEIDVSESLSAEDKKTIIQAFDDLAPEKEYKINYIEEHPKADKSISQENYSSLTAAENATLRKLKNKRKLSSKEKKQLTVLTNKISSSYKSEISVEETALPPINTAVKNSVGGKTAKKKKQRLKDLVADRAAKQKLAEGVTRSRRGTIMVQIASVGTKASAESEYNRLLRKNSFLKGKGKKIYKVDLGPNKGTRYRIQVGPFKNKTEAKKIISAMHDNGCAAYISK
ncbi:MAG: SPOR domain-containing protein [Alphaproteobacteria bacterium]|nr:SPOR domain-containing protein [Alphaproteobacteria bacterium]